MHGRPRSSPKPEDAEGATIKAGKLRVLQSQLLHNHHKKIYTKEAVDLSGKLLEINPESYTAWNYRKCAVEFNLSQSNSDSESIKLILDEELRIVESALRQNYKSYGAWHHRKWVLCKGHSSIDHELQLLGKFQKADSRNFHAWNYRRFVAESLNRSDEEELKYTTDMIDNNFSNYSAWHNRSVLLSHLLENKTQGYHPKETVLTEELELVHNAIFTDPDDQSGWFYHLWLLDQTVRSDNPLLVSSYPGHGSDLILSAYGSDTRTFPLILYFNEPVKGVNLSTVIVESGVDSNENLIWKPLSTSKSSLAQVWATRLKYPNGTHQSLEASYSVKVSLEESKGISSTSGVHFRHPYQFSFTVRMQTTIIEQPEEQGIEKIVWGDENFHINETHFQDLIPIVSLNQLKIEGYPEEDGNSTWKMDTLINEIALFRELLSEVNCKIGKLTLARLLMMHDTLMSYNTRVDKKIDHYEEVLELFQDLIKLDQPHSQYYRDHHSLVLLNQVTSSPESLQKHCYEYINPTSSNEHVPLCLRLNNLSLSRVGSVERLLWVKVLDLSHNKLQSIEGLEAMQLLCALNLSNNKLSSFAALEPLKLLKSLKVLNISHNEIGAHSIDTKRYLCSSPLSLSVESTFTFDKIGSDEEVRKYWEAYLLFKDLNLTQLDITGNAIVDEKFNFFLFKVLPKVK